jgi:hypothetical protein
MNWELGSLYIFPNSFLGKKKLKKPNTIIHKKWSTYFSIRQQPTTRLQTDRNGGRKCQRFAKLKEVFCQRSCRHKNTTFNFAQPHPKPSHHPDKIVDNIY